MSKAVKTLVAALKAAHAPPAMIKRAESGYYDDYLSPLVTPIMQLVQDANSLGLRQIAQRARNGDFDGTSEDAEAWAKSKEGQETFRHFGGRPD